MKIPIPISMNVLAFIIVLCFNFSCSKDSDLFNEYVSEEGKSVEQQDRDPQSDDPTNPQQEEEPIAADDSPIDSELKAFPGAEGFARYATGGRGGTVIEVTNLNDSGSGSLRSAINASGPRTVVFKVAGYITLNSTLDIDNGDITIAGQTAPGDGITIRRSSSMDQPAFWVTSNNIIVRGIRVRSGRGRSGETSGDNLTMTSGSDIIFDHCSFSWSTDELANPAGSSRITFQNCIFSEALMDASHGESGHSMGMLIGYGSSEITIYNSIFAHNNQRNPLIGGGGNTGSSFEIVNNVYYNYGEFGTVLEEGNDIRANLINNYHIAGPDTKTNRYPILVDNSAKVYVRGNISDFRPSSSDAEWDAVGNALQGSEKMSTNSQKADAYDFPLMSTATKSSSTLLKDVTTIAGAFIRDDVDNRVISEIYSGSGNIIDDPSQVGGYPNLNSGTPYVDSDGDGISDSWEISANLDPNNSSDGNQDRNNDGYTNLEEFLHNLAVQKTNSSL
ncbi:hypothetical protein [Spongiimicrobium sp. 3-5]|uniref:hypothetical protein n=1 Tax=Spongiimicrobium sp. 3-5 TaxID=3332596 RepID=UPI0039808B9A